jgi:RNA polymerase sigma-70 factor, ECF subfamily
VNAIIEIMNLFKLAPAAKDTTLEAEFTDIVNKHVDEIFNYACYMVADKNEAEDIVQNTFLGLHKNFRKLDTSKPIRAWLYKVARNNCLDYLKKKKALNFAELSEEQLEIPEYVESMEEKVNSTLLTDKLKELLQELPIAVKEVMILKYFEDLTFEQISEQTGLPVNTVKSHFYRGKTKLFKSIKESNLWI